MTIAMGEETGLPELKARAEFLLAWLFRLLGRLRGEETNGRGRCVILAYHRVLPRERIPGFPFFEDLITSLESFEEQMALLERRACVLPLEDLFRALREGRELPPGTVSLTFDDGYADNYHFAFPVLRRHRLPATLFLATGHVGGGRG